MQRVLWDKVGTSALPQHDNLQLKGGPAVFS
jgi:hypothetical protein